MQFPRGKKKKKEEVQDSSYAVGALTLTVLKHSNRRKDYYQEDSMPPSTTKWQGFHI